MGLMKYTSCDNKPDLVMCEGAFYASQKLPATGGRFVYYDISDGYWKACTDNITTFGGWVEQADAVTSTTNGGTKYPIIDVEGRVFELPYATSGAASTLTEAVGKTLIGKKIDLYVDANGIQYADNAANQAVLQVKGYDAARNTLKVMVIPAYIVQVA